MLALSENPSKLSVNRPRQQPLHPAGRAPEEESVVGSTATDNPRTVWEPFQVTPLRPTSPLAALTTARCPSDYAARQGEFTSGHQARVPHGRSGHRNGEPARGRRWTVHTDQESQRRCRPISIGASCSGSSSSSSSASWWLCGSMRSGPLASRQRCKSNTSSPSWSTSTPTWRSTTPQPPGCASRKPRQRR